VQNTNELHSQVAMIDVRARRPSETMTMADPQPSMASPTRLSLDRCIARGAATVIGMQEETPLSVRWNQGLIVTPRRLITTGGSTSNPTRFEDIAINLIHVTAVCREGLYQVERRPGAAYQLAVDVVAEQCILMTDEQSPLYEFVGVSNVAQGDLHYDGQGNLYPNPNAIFLRYRGAGGNLPVEHSLKQRGLIWSEERNPQTGDPWESELDLSLPPHSRTKFDFLPTAAMTIDAGYDSAQLPEAAADQPPMAAPPMPPIPMSPSPPAPTGVVPASAEGEAE
jgi:hypothetical protein